MICDGSQDDIGLILFVSDPKLPMHEVGVLNSDFFFDA